MSSVTAGWRAVFERGRLVPPHSHTVRLAANVFSDLGASPFCTQETSEGEHGVTYQLRVTLFDRNHQHFFGKTWKSTPQRMKANHKILFNEVLYFHTSLRLPSMMAVLELVALSVRPDGTQQALGRGFTILELFPNKPEARATDGDRRLNLHNGSPRSLLHPLLKDSVECNVLKTIDGAHLDCVIKGHPALVSMMHLLPENVLVSGDENIPGLAASPTGDALLRPQLLNMLPYTLDRLTVSLQPSLEKFESQLLQLINADCHNTQPGSEGTARTVVIQERRLHVGIHNGWCFLEKPQVVVLEPEASGFRARSGSTSNKSSLAVASLPQVLGLRSSLELRLTNDKALAIIFQLEYVFSAPIGRETTLSVTSTSRAAFMQCLRWGIWCPFQGSADWRGEEIQLALHGGAMPNPHGVMVYSTEMSTKAQSPCPVLALLAHKAPLKHSSCHSHCFTGIWILQYCKNDVQLDDNVLYQPLLLQACSAASNIAHLEMSFQRDGNVSPTVQDDGDQLQELPFTPVHAPVITLGMNVPSSCSVSSRSSLAHLYSAGFPDILDCSGQVAEVLDPTEPMHFDPQREEAELLQGNLLVFQFLAFSRIPTAGVSPDWPDNIYFTFQFYRFPPVTSQQLKLLTSDKVQQKASDPLPCVLASINKDGTVNSGSPGLQIQFRVDEGFLRPGEKRWFLRYLALHSMQIDIWDSDSLLLIGSTAIELKYMLRQGRSAVQALHEVEVLTTDYVGEDTLLTSTEAGRRSASSSMIVHTILRGRLHILLCSVNLFMVMGCFSLAERNIARAKRLEMDRDLVALFRNKIKADAPMPDGRNPDEPNDSRQHKLNRMAAVHQREGKEAAESQAKVTKVTEQAQLARELHQIKPYQERNKAEGIANMLSQAITTQHLVYASLGSAEYMEFVLKNPFNVPQTVTIHSEDPDLSVVTNTEEWRYFKTLTNTPTPLEENMFHLEEGSPGPRVYLRPKESIHIPLKYQTFLCDHTIALQVHPLRSGSVVFKAEDGKPMAICQVNVEPTPHVVDQAFRLYHPELCFLKKAIRLPPWHSSSGDASYPSCPPSPGTTCQTAPGEPQDVYLKVPGSPSPHIKMFFVMVFTDKWMAAPSQIWQIYVHFLERVDVSCVTGQRSCQSLVLRGKQAVRKVKCFSSHPQEIEVDPTGVFVLPPAAVQELQLKVQPWRAGSRFLYVNAVDVEHRRLLTTWLLCLNVHRPVLSKAFEVCVPVGGGRGSSKRITYTNPYTGSRVFVLRSDHPDLLQFKEDKFQIGGGESYTIGLRFAPSQSSGSVEILIYVNNLEEKTEETFCVKVNYS
uniref:Nephrocystin 4 n=1 Tax=Myripristis murdjan TaxID=586833 RepID=A0A667WGD4_9TELE